MTKFLKTKKYIILLFLFGLMISSVYFYYQVNGKTDMSDKKVVLAAKTNLPVLYEKDLKGYNGENPKKPIYIGLDGYVYDVTAGRKFYQTGGAYHDLAGKDSTNELKIFGSGIIKRKYPIVAVLRK